MTLIELSDDQALALKAKAAAQGLSLEEWLAALAASETPAGPSRPAKSRYRLSDLIAQCDLNAPPSAEDQAWRNAPAVGREAI
jgi:hypothetical protein